MSNPCEPSEQDRPFEGVLKHWEMTIQRYNIICVIPILKVTVIRPWTLNAISVYPVVWHYAQSQAEYVLEYVPFKWRPVYVLPWNDCLATSVIFLSYASTYFAFFFFWPATRFYSFTLFFVSVHVCSENGIFNYVPLRSTLCSYALPLKSCLLWLTHFFYTWNLSDFMIAIRVLLTAKYASVCVCTGAVTVKNVLRF